MLLSRNNNQSILLPAWPLARLKVSDRDFDVLE